MNREDFEMLKSDIIFFDNNATTFKPKEVVDAVVEYYTKYTSNAHRGDYKTSLKVDMRYEEVRELVKDYINAESSKEIVFTSGATDSLNMVAFGFFKNILKKGDEVLITKLEHASNVLPWLELESEIGIKVKYAKLDENLKLTPKSLEESLTKNTKLVSLAHVTNTIGDVRDIEKISSSNNLKKAHPIKRNKNDLQYKYVENKLGEIFGTRVKVFNNKLEISFDNDSDLDRILEIMNIKLN